MSHKQLSFHGRRHEKPLNTVLLISPDSEERVFYQRDLLQRESVCLYCTDGKSCGGKADLWSLLEGGDSSPTLHHDLSHLWHFLKRPRVHA